MIRRFLFLFNRMFIFWILAAGLMAYAFPSVFLAMRGGMDGFFALTMFGVGMALRPEDFLTIWQQARIVLIGTIAQFTIMPFSAYLVSRSLHLSPEWALGMILTGSAPGAMASNVLSYLAGADAAYSVSLTTASTFLAPLLTPGLTLLLGHTLLPVAFLPLFLSVVKMVLLPVLAGLWLRRRFPSQLEAVVPLFPVLSTLCIALICGLVVAMNRDLLDHLPGIVFVAAVLLNLLGLGLGYGVGRLFGFDLRKRRALSIEVGMQNAGLGSVLALKHFGPQVALPAAVFVFVCLFSASLLVSLWSRHAILKMPRRLEGQDLPREPKSPPSILP